MTRSRLRRALELEASIPDPAFSARVLSAPPEPRRRGQPWPALAAAALAVMVVGGLLVTGNKLLPAGRTAASRPGAAHPHVAATGAAPASTPIPVGSMVPAEDLAAGGLENVASLITPLNASADSGGRTIQLIGGYADSARTVFILRGLPSGGYPSISVYDDLGMINASSSGQPSTTGDYVYAVNSAPHTGGDGLAHVRLDISQYDTSRSTPAGTAVGPPVGNWSVAVVLPVQPSRPLSAPSQVVVSGLVFQLVAVEATPNAIHVLITEQGATIDQLSSPQSPRNLQLTGPAGAAPRQLALGSSVTATKQQLQLNPELAKNVKIEGSWLRGTGGTYRLTIRYNGDERTLDLDVR